MYIAVIDADLIGRKRHRFPNLVCMKISGYHKAQGDSVTLKTDYDNLSAFDKVYIAKVFTDTEIPSDGLFGSPLDLPNIEYGGTEFKAYKDYSIGFLTRGCFRHCPFCVNRRSNRVVKHSPLAEFLDDSRKKICLLDDNFFGYDGWRDSLQELIDTGKPFHFKQGLDVRLLDDEKAELLFSARYAGDYIFAFDNWRDAELIESKMQLIRRYHKSRQRVKFYTFCAYDRGVYNESFWRKDLQELVLRMRLLKKYDFLPYVMRFEKWKDSPYRACYVDLAAYGNQPRFFGSKMPFVEFAIRHRNGKAAHPFDYELQKILES